MQTARGLYQRWCELLDDPSNCSKEEYDWTTNELRNSLRSIEWDLEDLEETINILLLNYCFMEGLFRFRLLWLIPFHIYMFFLSEQTRIPYVLERMGGFFRS